jgi:hypothetical protein
MRANAYAKVFHCSVAELTLPVETVDVLMSFWMGQALLYKSRIVELLKARDRWLALDGIMFPDSVTLNVFVASAVFPVYPGYPVYLCTMCTLCSPQDPG